MEAVRKISQIKDNTLILKGLQVLNNRIVEVIILPVLQEEREHKQDMKEEMFKFCRSVSTVVSDNPAEFFCGIFQENSSLTESLLEERKKDIEIEEKKIAR